MSKNQTISEALKALFLELGGDASKLADNQKISDYIDDLATVIGATPEPFDVVYTCTEAQGTQTLSKTPAEILEAYNAGKVVRFIATADNYFYDSQYSYDIKLTMSGVFKYGQGDLYYLCFVGYCNGFSGYNPYSVNVAISNTGDVELMSETLY